LVINLYSCYLLFYNKIHSIIKKNIILPYISIEGIYIINYKKSFVLNYKAVIIGTILLIILTAIFIRTAGSLSGWMDYLIASIFVGFLVGEDIYKGMFNGVVTTLIGGILVLIIEITMLKGDFDIITLIIILIYSLIVMLVMGIIGSAIGFSIKSSQYKNNFKSIKDFQKSDKDNSGYIKYSQKSGKNNFKSIKDFQKPFINPPKKQSRVLRCKSCKGEYILKPDELPGDFQSCNCGGELEFYDTYGHRRPFTTHYRKERKERPLSTKILIIIVVGIFSLYYVFPFFMVSIIDYVDPSIGVYIFPIFFAASIAIILILIWYAFIRK